MATILTYNISENIKNTSLALGFFDGVHKGHQKVLNDAISYSKKLGTKSVVLTFKNHPVEVLYNVKPEFITTYQERVEIFKNMGFDYVIMADFTKRLSDMNAEDYFNHILMPLKPKSISIGYNHLFGAKQSGNIEFLTEKSKHNDFILSVSSPVKQKNEVTSSTLIRNLIKEGEVKKAHELLDKPYKITNTVIHGKKRGTEINYPTANLQFPDKKILPKFGVYSGNVLIDSKRYKAIANIGLRPTFNDLTEPIAEIHILNFNSDIYDKTISFEFLNMIRTEMKFPNIDKLKEQIKKDILSI